MADEIPGDVIPPATPVPDVVYDIKVEGLSPKVTESIVAEAKELGLTQDQALKMANKRLGIVKDFEKLNKAKIDGWKDELTKDKELGGDNFSKTIESRDRAIAKLIEKIPSIKESLSKSEVIDNPVMVRILHEIGKMSQDDVRRTGSPAITKVSMSERLLANYQTKG